MSQAVPPLEVDVYDTLRTNYVGFASFVILVWDHLDTFVEEVELVWKSKRRGLFVWLFLFNRYFTPLGFIINLYAYLSPVWTFERYCTEENTACFVAGLTFFRCARFVRYEGCTVAIAVEVVGLMMLLRINALYPNQKWISRSLGAILVIETIVNVWLISRGEPVVHNPNSTIQAWFSIHQCVLSGSSEIRSDLDHANRSRAASASAWIPLVYDTIVFGLTLYRTVPPIMREEASYILKRVLEDGLLYYSVIFAVTFVLTFMIVGAPPGIQNIAAQTEQLITVAMMSRITLNLKKAGRKLNSDELPSPKTLLFDRRRRQHSYGDMPENQVFSMPQTPLPSAHRPGRRIAITFAHPVQSVLSYVGDNESSLESEDVYPTVTKSFATAANPV